jgi:hypothetical protein
MKLFFRNNATYIHLQKLSHACSHVGSRARDCLGFLLVEDSNSGVGEGGATPETEEVVAEPGACGR